MAIESVHEKPKNADPLIEEPTEDAPHLAEMDYPAHIRTWNRFIHLIKWFVAHIVLVVISLYFFLIAGMGITGAFFLLCAVVALGYGIVTVERIGPKADADRANQLIPASH